ncbi:MAG: hypothetical protein U9N44_00715 [Chloroflexota bacterium]|nr:hypothetical protein [Chloroflexota bacterium]
MSDLNKAKLPIKTKIAAWWLCTIGIIWIVMPLTLSKAFSDQSELDKALQNLIVIGISIAILLVFPIILLYFRRKKTWALAIVTLSLELILLVVYLLVKLSEYKIYDYIFFSLFIACLLIPLILIILDRKNYFAMVRRRELQNKESGRE